MNMPLSTNSTLAEPRNASQLSLRRPWATERTPSAGWRKSSASGPSENTMFRKIESSGTRKKLLSATTLQREQFGRHQRKEVARQVSRLSINNNLGNFWGKRKLEKLIGFCLHSIAQIDTPVKEGTSAKYRTRPSASSLAETSPMAKGRQWKRNARNTYQSQVSLLTFRRSSCDQVLGQRLTFETGLMDRKNTTYAKI